VNGGFFGLLVLRWLVLDFSHIGGWFGGSVVWWIGDCVVGEIRWRHRLEDGIESKWRTHKSEKKIVKYIKTKERML